MIYFSQNSQYYRECPAGGYCGKDVTKDRGSFFLPVTLAVWAQLSQNWKMALASQNITYRNIHVMYKNKQMNPFCLTSSWSDPSPLSPLCPIPPSCPLPNPSTSFSFSPVLLSPGILTQSFSVAQGRCLNHRRKESVISHDWGWRSS